MSIELRGIDKYYGENHVLKSLDLTVEDGDFMTLLGPSGCGKTTTLRVLAGLERPENGTIVMGGREVVNAAEQFFAPPAARGLNLVFQSYALWPHMTVFDNVAFGLRVAKTPQAELARRVAGALERMQIAEFAERYPGELSGGQQQRVAIARAIVSEPGVLLLDEPLSNLDAKLRVDMRGELKRLHRELGTTILYVTHDQVEALTMSTKIAVFFEGALEQVGTPMEVYRNPASLRVADFIGNPRINLLPGEAERAGDALSVTSALGALTFSAAGFTPDMPPGGRFACTVGLRPEQMTLLREPAPGAIAAEVYACMPAGSETLVQLSVGGDMLLLKQIGLRHYDPGRPVWLSIQPESLNLFHRESGRLVGRAASDSEA